MRIAIGGDSAGRGLADLLVAHLKDRDGLEVTSISDTPSGAGELYAELSERAGHAILDGRFDRAILCCGTGIGVCMSANKIRGIRAAQTHDVYSAERAALSNDAHIITMGSRVIGPELAKSVAEAWLSKSFDPSSASAKNVDGVNELDKKYAIDRR